MVMHEEMTLRFIGVAPLLMRSGRMADPLDDHAIALQKITSKRTKTPADHLHIARIEWRGGLWLSKDRPCVPAEAIEAMMVVAGKTRRLGSKMRAAVIVRDSPLLEHPGPTDLEELFGFSGSVHRCGVRVNAGRTMRTRPQFTKWSLACTLIFLPSIIDRSTLLEVATVAGDLVGIGDYRPRFGRFLVEEAAG